MRITQTAKFTTAPYFELIERFGMKPMHRLTAIDGRTWVCSTPDAGLVRISHEAALEVMTVDALLWLRHERGVEFDDEDIRGKSPAAILRAVRDTARSLLARA